MSGCCPPGKGLPNSQAYSADAASPVPTLVPVFESSMLGVGRFWTMGAPAVPFPGGIVSLSLGFMNRNHPGQGNPWNFRHLQFPLLLRTINEPESGNYLQINDSARRMGNWSCPLRFSGTRHPCQCCQEGNVVFWKKIGKHHKDSIPFHLVYCVMTATLQDSNNVQNQTHIICHLTPGHL